MRSRLLLGVLLLGVLHSFGQTPFIKMESIKYKRKAFILGTELPDSVQVASAYVGKLPTLEGIRLDIRGTKDDSCVIVLTKYGKLLQRFTLAASVFWITDSVYIADIDHDGVFEILGKDHVYYKGHSYWAYNLYNFKDGRLINVSRKYDYPFWTKHLSSSFDTVPASNLSLKDRMTGFKPTPGEIF